jgi:hypothetical protein
MHSGVVMPGAFDMPPPNKFDIGADRGSREIMLAWERWHHQLSQAIYERWSARAVSPGQATLRITVTKNHQLLPTVISCRGGPGFEESLMDAINSLQNNPGLAFPSQSLRQEVSFEADYVA